MPPIALGANDMSSGVHVLVAFACQSGSTAGIAETIATELRKAGLAADCRPVAAVTDLAPYGAIVLGSGVFLVRRQSDGGGFIARHADELQRKTVWLFSAGPIGGPDPAAAGDPLCDEASVVRVAHSIGARGAATFGTARLRVAAYDGGLPLGDSRDLERVQAWARSIAAELCRTGAPDTTPQAGADGWADVREHTNRTLDGRDTLGVTTARQDAGHGSSNPPPADPGPRAGDGRDPSHHRAPGGRADHRGTARAGGSGPGRIARGA
jgi:menaquinone-dependent protoporphyrinogen oxidase